MTMVVQQNLSLPSGDGAGDTPVGLHGEQVGRLLLEWYQIAYIGTDANRRAHARGNERRPVLS